MCCDIMKKNQLKKYERETGNKPILATTACESALRKTAWLKEGCNAFEAKGNLHNHYLFGQNKMFYDI